MICPNFASAFSPRVQLIRLSAERAISLRFFLSFSCGSLIRRATCVRCETEFCSYALTSRADSGIIIVYVGKRVNVPRWGHTRRRRERKLSSFHLLLSFLPFSFSSFSCILSFLLFFFFFLLSCPLFSSLRSFFSSSVFYCVPSFCKTLRNEQITEY